MHFADLDLSICIKLRSFIEEVAVKNSISKTVFN